MPTDEHEFYGIKFCPNQSTSLFKCDHCKCLVEFEDIISHGKMHKITDSLIQDLFRRLQAYEDFVASIDGTVVPIRDTDAHL